MAIDRVFIVNLTIAVKHGVEIVDLAHGLHGEHVNIHSFLYVYQRMWPRFSTGPQLWWTDVCATVGWH